MTLEATGDRLTGHKSYVIDGHCASLILVVARERDLRRRGRRPRPDPHPARDDGPDPQAGAARVRRHAGPAARAATGPPSSAILDRAAVALAAEQAGGAARCLEMATEYASERVQFGRPIGSFQAIKHKCANLLMETESAKSAAMYAAWAADEDEDELALAAPLAKAYCSEAFMHAAAENIQIHGGIGFTWEHPAHLYFKRAKTSELLLGEPAYHRELLASRLGV